MNGRLDRHLVQGHVDATGTCTGKTIKDGSWEFEISFPRPFAELIIEKGSICLNGCLLYTSDAADDLPCVELGGRRIIKKKKINKIKNKKK